MSNKLGYYICERNILNIYSDSQNGSLRRPEVQLDFKFIEILLIV